MGAALCPGTARDPSRADDLVQSCLVRAIAKAHLWQPGTDLRAWLFTILHNQHVNDIRGSVREGASVPVEEIKATLTVAPNAVASLQLRDLERAIASLPAEQRQVILFVGLEGMSYEKVAAILRVSGRHRSLAPVAWLRDAAPENGHKRRNHTGRTAQASQCRDRVSGRLIWHEPAARPLIDRRM